MSEVSFACCIHARRETAKTMLLRCLFLHVCGSLEFTCPEDNRYVLVLEIMSFVDFLILKLLILLSKVRQTSTS